MSSKRTCIVILSGGMDSTVLAHHVASLSGHQLIGCVSVNYGQRHKKELLCAAKTCKHLNVEHFLVDLQPLGRLFDKSSLTGDVLVPHGHYAEKSMKAT